jgi:localization factor PodJL
MNSRVPWLENGLEREAREKAQEAARRSGMSVGEWLSNVISESAQNTDSVRNRRLDREPPPVSHRYTDPRPRFDDEDRYEADRLSETRSRSGEWDHRGPRSDWNDASPRQINEALSRLDRSLGRLAGRGPTPEFEARARAFDRPGASDGAPGLDDALSEIEARQRALDGEATPPRTELPRAPTQGLSNLEQQLRTITSRIETLQPCGIDRAVETLRDDLAEIGVMLKEASPRNAVEALESEVRSLGARIDSQRPVGPDSTTIAGIEHGLAEVRDALRSLTPAESFSGFDEAVQSLAQKIDRIAGASADPAAMRQLEGAIAGLRGIVSHVASNDAIAKLSEEMRSLAAKVEQAPNVDAFSMLERRMAAISDSLQNRTPTGLDPHDLKAVFQGLAEKLDRLSLTRSDHAAVAHLEDRIARLVEKLDASDSRLNNLDAIERGLAELLIHFEQKREPQPADVPAPEAEALKRDLRQTQDSLEAVHGTLGHVVDRLATIETSIRESSLPKAANIPDLPQPAHQPSIAAVPAAVELTHRSPAMTNPAATVASQTPNPAPAAERRPIDPSLPPDHPLEPGLARGRGSSPAERIAASEADLGTAKPPVIPDPGGKPNFIAAARRAAQAAIVEAPVKKEKGEKGERGGTRVAAADGNGGNLGQRARPLIVAASALLIFLGALHVASNMFSSADAPADNPAGAAAQLQSQPAAATAASEPAAPVSPAITGASTPAVVTPSDSMPALPAPATIEPPSREPAAVPDREPTGSVHANPQSAGVTGVTPLPPPAPGRTRALPPGADRLPAAIGSGGLRAAAAKGDPAAEYEVASRYADGRGVARNLSEAATWFERAAKRGLVPAQFRLGGLHEKGLGVAKDLAAARRLYLMAAEAGHAKAMHNLAVLHAEGIDGKPDYQTAARWFRKAADHGVTDSQYNLGILYARGIGVETNMAEAFKWFALASRNGDREAAKKRDDVAGRLDRQSLAAAMQAAQGWKALPQPESAIQVKVPDGGWDGVAGPSAAKRRVGPKG